MVLLGHTAMIILLLLAMESFGTDSDVKFRSNELSKELGPSKFSAAPSGLPIRRVNVHGNQLLLRQMFVDPIRPFPNGSAPTLSENDQEKRATEDNGLGCSLMLARSRSKRQSCGCGGCCGGRCGGGGGARCGGGSCAQQSSAAAYPQPQQQYNTIPQTGPQSSNDQSQSQPAQFQHPAWRQEYPQQPRTAVQVAPARLNYHETQSQYPATSAVRPTYSTNYQQQRAEPRLQQNSYASKGRVAPVAPGPKWKSQYPLPECYTDDSNFMCCNAQLEETMHQAYQHLVNSIPNFHRCNIQRISNTVQSFAERRFNTSFEVVTGLTDYASKSHFFSNYICKVLKDKRYILAYATPRWDLEGQAKRVEASEESYATLPQTSGKVRYPVSPRRSNHNNHVFMV